MAQIRRFIPARSEIELLELSHTDADHIVAAGQVLQEYKVKKLLWGGYERSY
jgi:beta-lactamase superfamily II metal-dependent hydrolase